MEDEASVTQPDTINLPKIFSLAAIFIGGIIVAIFVAGWRAHADFAACMNPGFTSFLRTEKPLAISCFVSSISTEPVLYVAAVAVVLIIAGWEHLNGR